MVKIGISFHFHLLRPTPPPSLLLSLLPSFLPFPSQDMDIFIYQFLNNGITIQGNVSRPPPYVLYRTRSNTSLSLRLMWRKPSSSISFFKEIWAISRTHQLRGNRYAFVKYFTVLQRIAVNYWDTARFKTDAFWSMKEVSVAFPFYV